MSHSIDELMSFADTIAGTIANVWPTNDNNNTGFRPFTSADAPIITVVMADGIL